MFTLFMIIHVIISVALILVILAQSSKGGALDGLVGGAAANVLGGQGASNFLKNATKIIAVLFMINCLILAFLNTGKKAASSKVVDKLKKEVAEQQTTEELPALPETETPVTEPAAE